MDREKLKEQGRGSLAVLARLHSSGNQSVGPVVTSRLVAVQRQHGEERAVSLPVISRYCTR